MKKQLLFLLLAPFSIAAQDFWSEVSPFSSGADYLPNEISIVDDNVVWVRGYDFFNPTGPAKFSISLDAGSTWTEGTITLSNPSLSVLSLHATTATTAYVTAAPTQAGPTGGVWKTTDAGATWAQQPSALFSSANSFPNFIHFFDENKGIVVGDPESGYFEIYTTANAGANWTRVPQANIPVLLSGEYGYNVAYETRGNSVWFGTNKGRIFRSHDMGLNWSVSQSPLTDFNHIIHRGCMAFKNADEGVLISGEWQLWHTIDSGASWQLAPIPDLNYNVQRNYRTVYVPQTNNAYFSWGEDIIDGITGASYTTDGCLSWHDLNQEDLDPVVPHIAAFQSGTVGYCVGYSSGSVGFLSFFRLTDPLFRLLKNDAFIAAKSFSAAPNPTSDTVKLSGGNIRKVSVYDFSGKVVFASDYNNTDDVAINIATFQSGIYLAKVTADDGTVSTVKIIKK